MKSGMYNLLVFSLISLMVSACSKDKEPDKSRPEPVATPEPQAKPAGPRIDKLTPDDEVAVISTEAGRIILRFYPHVAPNHVNNFKSLAQAKFYDGTTFHRVIPGFMIQGGDPNSRDADMMNDGSGDGPRRLRAEFSSVHHGRGILSMARSQDPNSASCQFFICVGDAGFLDGQYTVFGEVAEGMEAVDKIVALPRNERDNPGKAATIRTITVKRAGDVLKFPRPEPGPQV